MLCYVSVTSYSLRSSEATAASAQDGVTQDVGELEQGENRDTEEQGRNAADVRQERQPLQRRNRDIASTVSDNNNNNFIVYPFNGYTFYT